MPQEWPLLCESCVTSGGKPGMLKGRLLLSNPRLAPQHLPFDRESEQVSEPAPAIESTSVSPDTGTGVSRSKVVPSPSCPLSFWPQHLTEPPLSKAQVKY